MKTTVKHLDEIKQTLSKLLTASGIPVRVAYRATKFSKFVQKEVTELEEQRLALVRKYGKEDGHGGVRVMPDQEEAFKLDYEQVLEEEVELPEIKIKVDDLANAGLTMLDIANLDFMLVEVDPTEK